VPFEGVEQIGQAGHEPFATNPVGDFPEADERALDGATIRLLAWSRDRSATGHGRMAQEGDRIFAMIAGGGNEFIEDARFVGARREDVARRNGRREFTFTRRTHHRLVFLPCSERTA